MCSCFFYLLAGEQSNTYLSDELYECDGFDDFIQNSDAIDNDDVEPTVMKPLGMQEFSLDPDDLTVPENLPGLAPVECIINLHVIYYAGYLWA